MSDEADIRWGDFYDAPKGRRDKVVSHLILRGVRAMERAERYAEGAEINPHRARDLLRLARSNARDALCFLAAVDRLGWTAKMATPARVRALRELADG